MKLILTGLLLALCMSACGGSPTSPDNLSGTWAGTFTDAGGTYNATMSVLVSDAETLSGNWNISEGGLQNGGLITGNANGAGLTMTLTPNVPTLCPYNATASINGGTMTGTYSAFNCTVAVNGSFRLTRH